MRRRSVSTHTGLILGLVMLVACSDAGPGDPTISPEPEPSAEVCPASSEWDPESGKSPPEDPPAGTCEPGPDEMTGALVIDSASLEPGEEDEVLIELEVTNTTELSRAMLLPTSADPRVDEDQGVRRLSFLRVNMVFNDAPDDGEIGEPRVNVGDPGWPEWIAVAAGETLTYTDTIFLETEAIAEQMMICAEVKYETHPDAPASQHETGHTSYMIVRGFGWEQDPVPITCSEVFDVGFSG